MELPPKLLNQLLCELLCKDKPLSEEFSHKNPNIPSGQTYISVLDRGFVFVGKTSVRGDYLEVTNARIIRIWGTTKSLGELKDGPKEKTILDEVGDMIAPMKSLIYFIKCNRDW